jgi:hypothetical protein
MESSILHHFLLTRHCLAQVRGKVAVSLAASAQRMSAQLWAGYEATPLLRAAGKLVVDNTPEARDAAKRLIALLRDAFEVASEAGEPSGAGQVCGCTPRCCCASRCMCCMWVT